MPADGESGNNKTGCCFVGEIESGEPSPSYEKERPPGHLELLQCTSNTCVRLRRLQYPGKAPAPGISRLGSDSEIEMVCARAHAACEHRGDPRSAASLPQAPGRRQGVGPAATLASGDFTSGAPQGTLLAASLKRLT